MCIVSGGDEASHPPTEATMANSSITFLSISTSNSDRTAGTTLHAFVDSEPGFYSICVASTREELERILDCVRGVYPMAEASGSDLTEVVASIREQLRSCRGIAAHRAQYIGRRCAAVAA